MATRTGTNDSETLIGTRGADTLSGLGGDDKLVGGRGNDTLIGGRGDDLLLGGADRDIFSYRERGFGDDVIDDFSAGDRISLTYLGIGRFDDLKPYITDTADGAKISLRWFGYSESILISGVSANALKATDFIFNTSNAPLTVTGTAGDDVVFGGAGNDTLFGLGGRDELNGGAGNDILVGGVGVDFLRGGAGKDIFSYRERGFGNDAILDFSPGDRISLTYLGIGDFDTLKSYFTDTPEGGTRISLSWNGYSETIRIDGVPSVSLKASDFIFNTSVSPLTVEGTNARDVLFGGNGKDTLLGLKGHDDLNGGAGDDILVGGAGDDLLRGGAGADIFSYRERGFGVDVIDDFGARDRISLTYLNVSGFDQLKPYISDTADGAKITLGWGIGAESILIKGVSAASLTASDFIFNTSTVALEVRGPGGDAVLFGGRGDDTLYGGGGELNGGAGNDTLRMSFGENTLRGGAGVDTFVVSDRGLGRNVIEDFEAGERISVAKLNVGDFDTLKPYMTDTPGGTLITLGWHGLRESILVKDIPLDLLSSSDFIFNTSTASLNVTGTKNVDILFGGDGDDKLRGYEGADELNGGRGNDILNGGAGADVLRGGQGADTFRFSDLSTSAADADRIVDFEHGVDRIEFDSAVFKGLSKGALSESAFHLGTAAADGADRLIYDSASGSLLYDADGTGSIAAVKIAELSSHPTLSASDIFVS